MTAPEAPVPLDGVLVVDKPTGLTSHDVVARVRRSISCHRVGHTGTLDPLATGVLVLVLGRATRLARFLSAEEKAYDATIVLGIETDTYDVEGRNVAQHHGPLPDARDVASALERLRAQALQLPPPYSAKKLAGVPAYRLARRRETPALRAVPVELKEARLLDYAPPVARLRLTSSAGYYVRSLAHDLGAALGCGAHLAALRRTRSGEFDLAQAVPLAVVLETPDVATRRLVPMRDLLPRTDAVVLTAAAVTVLGSVDRYTR